MAFIFIFLSVALVDLKPFKQFFIIYILSLIPLFLIKVFQILIRVVSW